MLSSAQRIIVEGDTLEIVYALRQDSCCWSRYGQLVDDVKIMLNCFQAWFVGHINGEANETVYCLTKVALHQSLEQVWMKEYLVIIQNIVPAVQHISSWFLIKVWKILLEQNKQNELVTSVLLYGWDFRTIWKKKKKWGWGFMSCDIEYF